LESAVGVFESGWQPEVAGGFSSWSKDHVGVYFGASTTFNALRYTLDTGTVNTNATTYLVEYWDGSRWRALRTQLVDGATNVGELSAYMMTETIQWMVWAVPKDWATRSINSSSAYYWVRVKKVGAETSGPTDVPINILSIGTSVRGYGGLHVFQFPTAKRYVSVLNTIVVGNNV
jgi:hypothetical protein